MRRIPNYNFLFTYLITDIKYIYIYIIYIYIYIKKGGKKVKRKETNLPMQSGDPALIN